MKSVKRFLVCLLTLLLVLSMAAGCAHKKPSAQSEPVSAASQSETVSEPSSGDSLALIDSKPTQAPTQTPAVSSAPASESTKPESKPESVSESEPETEGLTVTEDGTYISKDEVALYIHTFGHLPSNFITKREAKKLGWKSTYSTIDKAAPGMSIGGDYFGNNEGILPKGNYTECDINYVKGSRGSERLVFSDDGRIYYTGDHYASYEQLY